MLVGRFLRDHRSNYHENKLSLRAAELKFSTLLYINYKNISRNTTCLTCRDGWFHKQQGGRACVVGRLSRIQPSLALASRSEN